MFRKSEKEEGQAHIDRHLFMLVIGWAACGMAKQ